VSGATSTYGVVSAWDAQVYAAEMTRQAAVASGTDAKTADLAYAATVITAAIANNINPSTFQQALAEVLGKGHP
jgi:hypothetical protein